MANKIKFCLKSFYKPTPIALRRLGDAFLLISTLVAFEFKNNVDAAFIASLTGVIGKFLTNFFYEPNKRDTES